MASSTFGGAAPSRCIRFKHQQPGKISAAYATSAHIGGGTRSSNYSLYEVLGIPMGATCQEVKAAYRRLARVVHPDVNSQDMTSSDEFMRVHKAYTTLSDPEKRADYDRTLMFRLQRRPRGSAHVLSATNNYTNRSSAGHYSTRRTWETDQCW